jgi:hypothetical protein
MSAFLNQAHKPPGGTSGERGECQSHWPSVRGGGRGTTADFVCQGMGVSGWRWRGRVSNLRSGNQNPRSRWLIVSTDANGRTRIALGTSNSRSQLWCTTQMR